MPLIQSFNDIIEHGRGLRADSFKVPNLQSDYVIGIMPSYKENVNASDFKSVLLTSLGTEYLQNGLKMEKNQWGFSSANMAFNGNSLTFSFIGIKEDFRESDLKAEKEYVTTTAKFGANGDRAKARKFETGNLLGKKGYGAYPSLIHYYYARQLTDQGTLRIKTSNWSLPAIYIFNLRTSSPIYVLKNCKFSLPTFSTSPSSNDFIVYQTTAYYDSFVDLQNSELIVNYKAEANDEKDQDIFKELTEALSKVK